jgi:hypothetical protein
LLCSLSASTLPRFKTSVSYVTLLRTSLMLEMSEPLLDIDI